MGAYERNNFQITFDANGGAFPGGGTTTTAWVWYGDNYHFPAAPVRDGHIFLGWCPGLLGRPITASTRVDATTVFNACWASADAATVALPFADGPGDVSSGAAVVNGKPVTLTAKPHKDALFLEWTSSDGDVFSTPTIKVAPAQTTAYVARFRYKADCEPPEVTVGKKSNWAMVGVPLTVDIFVNDAARPVKFSAAKLPPGLKINPATGQVTGIPTKAGTYVGATVTATSLADPKKKTSVTSPPMTVQPLPASVVGTFNGYVQDSDGNMNGAFTATISASGKITAKATTADGTFSFAVPSFSESTWSGGGQFVVEAKTAKGQTLCLEIDGFFPWSQWQYTYGGLNGTHNIIVQRNPFIDKNDANKDAAVAYFAPHSKQYCTLVLANGGIIHNSGDAGNNPEGYGYLTITASDKGSAKLAGKLADGTAVSGSAVLFTGAFGEAWAYGFVPLYGKQGFLSSEFYLNTDGTLGGCALWHYPGKTPAGKAPATEDRFSIWLDARGGRYTPPASLAAYYAQALAFFIGNPSAPGNWMSAVEILEGTRGALLLPKAKAPFLDKGTGLYVFTPGNPTVATLTANAKTGLFSGTFNWYDEVPDGKGGSKPKATTVKHQGVLTQQGGAFPGAGHYLLPSPYADPANPKAKYNLKRSYPVIIDLRDTM
ncbi:MAG: InlB B-repeat-containing protein [Kiritimatiellaeota bacterium]|nr:InlB B-repeat-containing protein [Kiritimatiellota bacterium]